jgi:hypothetical protein
MTVNRRAAPTTLLAAMDVRRVSCLIRRDPFDA